jgi:hypothetical protein
MLIVSIPWWLALIVYPVIATVRITCTALIITVRGTAVVVRRVRRGWQPRQP